MREARRERMEGVDIVHVVRCAPLLRIYELYRVCLVLNRG